MNYYLTKLKTHLEWFNPDPIVKDRNLYSCDYFILINVQGYIRGGYLNHI